MKLNFNNIEGYVLISRKLLPNYKEKDKHLVVVIAKPWRNNLVIILGKRIKKGDYLIINIKKKPKNNDFVLYNNTVRKLRIKKGVYYLKYISLKKTPLTLLDKEDFENITGVVIQVFQVPEFD